MTPLRKAEERVERARKAFDAALRKAEATLDRRRIAVAVAEQELLRLRVENISRVLPMTSLRDKVVEVLRFAPAPLCIDQVHRAVPEVGREIVKATLAQLADSKSIVRVSRGVYAAIEREEAAE